MCRGGSLGDPGGLLWLLHGCIMMLAERGMPVRMHCKPAPLTCVPPSSPSPQGGRLVVALTARFVHALMPCRYRLKSCRAWRTCTASTSCIGERLSHTLWKVKGLGSFQSKGVEYGVQCLHSQQGK